MYMRMLDEGLTQNSNDANPKSIPRILQDRAEEFKGQVSWLSQVANRLPGTVGISAKVTQMRGKSRRNRIKNKAVGDRHFVSN
jgi:hypothetical protein